MFRTHSCRFLFVMIATIIAAALGTACDRTSEQGVVVSEGGTDADVLAIVREEWISVYNAGDAAGLTNHFTEDAVLLNPGEPIVTGHDSLEATFEDWFSGPSRKLEILSSEVRSVGDLAVERADYTVRASDSPHTVVATGKYVMAWQRSSDGTWKIVWDIWSRNEPTP